jgi:hypothetical protein
MWANCCSVKLRGRYKLPCLRPSPSTTTGFTPQFAYENVFLIESVSSSEMDGQRIGPAQLIDE